MTQYQAIDRVGDLLDPGKNVLHNLTVEQARELLASGDADAVRRIVGALSCRRFKRSNGSSI